MNVCSFRWMILLLLCCGTALDAPAQPVDSPVEKSTRRFDFRVHEGYEGWARIQPTHVKVQYAGGMGVVSIGSGWDYGRKCRWETDLMIGLLPRSYSEAAHTIYTLKQNYIPWSIRWGRLGIEPFSCGLYVNLITGEHYWVREPERYPGTSYYGFTSRMRTHIYVGERLTYYPRKRSIFRSLTWFYELSANELDIATKFGNRSMRLSDIVYFSTGVKVQLMSGSSR